MGTYLILARSSRSLCPTTWLSLATQFWLTWRQPHSQWMIFSDLQPISLRSCWWKTEYLYISFSPSPQSYLSLTFQSSCMVFSGEMLVPTGSREKLKSASSVSPGEFMGPCLFSIQKFPVPHPVTALRSVSLSRDEQFYQPQNNS